MTPAVFYVGLTDSAILIPNWNARAAAFDSVS
jgi:hypothetical protein